LPAQLQLDRANDSPEHALPIRLERPAVVEVHVRDALGAPVAEVPVEAVPPENPHDVRRGQILTGSPHDRESTDASGTCVIENLRPHEELDVAVRSGIGLTQRQTVTLAPGERRKLEFVLGAGCSVRGTAVNERGELLASIDLWRLPTRGQS